MSPLQRLQRLDDYLTEFGLSFTTAKRVLKDLRQQSGNPTMYRPSGMAEMSGYLPRGVVDKKSLREGKRMYGVPRAKANSVVVPRDVSVKYGRVPVAGITPVLLSLHEHGHATDKLMGPFVNARQKVTAGLDLASATEASDRLGAKVVRTGLRVERRANQNVLASIQKHGTSGDVAAWKKFANRQMKVGYRTPAFVGIAGGLGANTLAAKKGVLRKYPFLRSKFTNLERLHKWSSEIHVGREPSSIDL